MKVLAASAALFLAYSLTMWQTQPGGPPFSAPVKLAIGLGQIISAIILILLARNRGSAKPAAPAEIAPAKFSLAVKILMGFTVVILLLVFGSRLLIHR
jgi:hypothetical protein